MHLLVARVDASKGLEVLTAERERTRLGEGMGSKSILTTEAKERGLSALGRLYQLASSHTSNISVFATSAIREAHNKADFINEAYKQFGVRVETISGVEEARLIHVGVSQALDVYNKKLFVFDIGGGSTEIVLAEQGEIIHSRSTKLGCIRLTDRFFPEGATTPEAITACSNYVRSYLASMRKDFSGFNHELAVGCSGTISAVASMIAFERGQPLRQLNGATFTYEELTQTADRTLQATVNQRTHMPGLDRQRADIITGGIVILREIMRSFSLHAVTVSSFALREGILYDQLLGEATFTETGLKDRNTQRLAEALDPDPPHGAHATKLALQLFDQLQDLHGLGKDAKELLSYAGRLHNIGLSVSHSSHHKHSYYIIRHSDMLTGFNEREIELMALISRYHRKAKPSKRHNEYVMLNGEDRFLVACLAGILRIAIGLDRRHSQTVSSVTASFDQRNRKVAITVESDDLNEQLDLELYAAQERASLLADTLDVSITLDG